MSKITIGSTGITVEQNAFGALPIQRVQKSDAVYLLQKALDGGIDFYDTSRAYSDSEEKLGAAFKDRRSKVVIATKTKASSAEEFKRDLETSLRTLNTDYIDIYQFHNLSFAPKPGEENGLYESMLQAKREGKIRFIGITNHRIQIASDAIESGLYDTLQFPFNYLSTDEELALVRSCENKKMGFIAMKGLSGGLITNARAACAWMMQHSGVLPIWGIQRETELDEFLSYVKNTPALTDELRSVIENDRRQLQGEFCRGCGYCMPCPQGIEINTCARASLLIRRAPESSLLSAAGREKMAKIEDCIECGSCSSQCPYGLDTPALLKRNYKDYKEILAGKPIERDNF